MGFAVKLDKPGGFIGREALLRATRVPACASVWCNSSSNPRSPLLYHNEPIWRGDSLVGFIRSGMYAHSLGAAVGLGYVTVPAGGAAGPIGADDYEIEVAGMRHAAIASLRPLYDPKNERIK